MDKCDYYFEYANKAECWGTKEREECSCCGDQSKCNFYPEKRVDAQEKWIEEFDGCYPDGFHRSRYRHESCGSVSSLYPYCPYCGKRVMYVKILKDGLEKYKIKRLEKLGYICIL